MPVNLQPLFDNAVKAQEDFCDHDPYLYEDDPDFDRKKFRDKEKDLENTLDDAVFDLLDGLKKDIYSEFDWAEDVSAELTDQTSPAWNPEIEDSYIDIFKDVDIDENIKTATPNF